MSPTDAVGFLAALLTLLTFAQSSMFLMRCSAIAANMAFILYGALGCFPPILMLHALLLPLNIIRLLQTILAGKRQSFRLAGEVADLDDPRPVSIPLTDGGLVHVDDHGGRHEHVGREARLKSLDAPRGTASDRISDRHSRSVRLAFFTLAPMILCALTVHHQAAASDAGFRGASDATVIAVRVGEVIGAASVCGMPELEIHHLQLEARKWMNDAVLTQSESAEAEAIFQASIFSGMDLIWRKGGGRCGEDIRKFNAFFRGTERFGH